ncbi:MAG: N(4)-(beta-N-acetylglucosaminyl)-L-asparaginase [Phaeodactylibacter sp.]|nr:N(4)-(beta-N-acetylglucosaminyl)-L-asparaginase [Phaeodactylibacter sp.]MCB9276858.1 N(4)-(beta-N-acetylglucosaminyl)-L-asparaginase [Lewinellaceae bacterium]
MSSRRKFLAQSAIGTLGIAFGNYACANKPGQEPMGSSEPVPTVLSTWNNQAANEAAWAVAGKGGRALDAVEQGVRTVEADPEDMSVGYGGRPDRDGHVTLDACIMDETGNCGSVCFLEHIKHPISVARLVMEKTPHVILAGEGALQFALENGFQKEDLLTEKARQEWEEWKKTSEYKPVINIESHDTIGMLALDQQGNMAGACTTSGLAYKIRGRVGDSPIIGAGMYVDNEVGGAVATGLGEAVLKSLGTFLIVELMRQGMSPQQACEEAIRRIISKQEGHKDFQVGFLALNKKGEAGAYSIQPGFSYALYQRDENKVQEAASAL